MPLPNPGTAWPPEKFGPVFDEIDECADWWEGNADKLAERYQRTAGQAVAGGLRGWLHSLWWGKPQDDQSDRLHVPVPAVLARTSAALLFADSPTFRVPKPDTGDDETPDPQWQAAQDRLDTIANGDTFRATLLQGAEKAAALSGVYLRVVWDRETCDHAFLDVVDPDMAIPEFRFGRLVAVTFWSELASQGDKIVYRHLERHSKGRIEHALYMGSRENIGNPAELERHPDTERFAKTVTDGTGYDTGADGLTATYVPNIGPNPKWRKDPDLKNLGMSDLTPDLFPLFDKIDELWSSLAREFDIGKGRLFVPEELLEHLGTGKGAVFDTDRKVYTLVQSTGDDTAQQTVQAEQFAIRVTEHLEAIDALVREVLRRAGYSPGTFGLVDDGGAMTATEVRAKREASLTTKTAKSRLWQAALSSILRTLLQVDAKQFKTGVIVDAIDVDWPPLGQESELTRAQTVQAMDGARAISLYRKVAYLNPEWNDDKIREEVDRILSDQAVLDPYAMPPDAPPPGTEVEPAIETTESDSEDGEPPAEDAEAIKKKAEALGMLVRAGVESEDAAARVGLPGARFTGLLPTSLKEPGSEVKPAAAA